MLSRQDDENLFLMFSDNSHFWSDPIPLQKPPSRGFVKIGTADRPLKPSRLLVITTGSVPCGNTASRHLST